MLELINLFIPNTCYFGKNNICFFQFSFSEYMRALLHNGQGRILEELQSLQAFSLKGLQDPMSLIICILAIAEDSWVGISYRRSTCFRWKPVLLLNRTLNVQFKYCYLDIYVCFKPSFFPNTPATLEIAPNPWKHCCIYFTAYLHLMWAQILVCEPVALNVSPFAFNVSPEDLLFALNVSPKFPCL